MPQLKLTQRADGMFRCKYHGKEFYGKTQSEALKKREAYIDAERKGYDHEMDHVSFREFALQWVDVYRSECCLSQKRQYINIVNYAADTLKKENLGSITAMDVQALCNTLTCYSSSYVGKFMTTLNGIFKTAVAEGAMIRNPMDLVKRPKTVPYKGHRALESWERRLIRDTYTEHEFGLCAMVMMYAGLRRGEAIYLDIDRDVDFEKNTLTVRGALSYVEANQPLISPGKTKAAQRTIPLVKPLADALRGHHGLVISKEKGGYLSETAFRNRYTSYVTFLEKKLNGCPKRWYGKTRAHKELIAEGKELPPWREINIRCHDFRVDFCTRAYEAGIPLKTLQAWMGHADSAMEVLLSRRNYNFILLRISRFQYSEIIQFYSK